MAVVHKNIDDITRTKTSVDGSERIPARDSLGDFKISVDNLKASIVSSPVYFTDENYVILDNDGYSRIEVDTTAGDITITLPLKANNLAREIEIANIKGGTNKVIVVPNATDANKLSEDGLAAMWLPKIGDFVKFRESQGSGFWGISNERITSQLRLNTYAGYGNASNNKIMYFTNTVENIGNCHTLTSNDNVTGCVITINRSGKYGFCFSYRTSASLGACGFSLNSAELTSSIRSINVTNRLSFSTAAAGSETQSSWTGYLKKGDVVRFHTDGEVSGVAARNDGTVTYLGN